MTDEITRPMGGDARERQTNMSKADFVPDLVDPKVAEELGLTTDEVAELIASGKVRTVYRRSTPDAPLEQRLLGCDVARVLKARDPRHLAALVRGEVDPDDPGELSPRALARKVPRF